MVLTPSKSGRTQCDAINACTAQNETALGEMTSDPSPCSPFSTDNLAFYFPEETEAIRSELDKLPPPLLWGSLCPQMCSLPCDYGRTTLLLFKASPYSCALDFISLNLLRGMALQLSSASLPFLITMGASLS